jgi:hypothetical protein
MTPVFERSNTIYVLDRAPLGSVANRIPMKKTLGKHLTGRQRKRREELGCGGMSSDSVMSVIVIKVLLSTELRAGQSGF